MKGVITLCGSTRFYKTFDYVCYQLTLNDWAVFTIGTMMNKDSELKEVDKKTKDLFDKLHREKILMSEAIFVVDPNGYTGEQTKAEIDFAIENGRDVYWYSKGDLAKLAIDTLTTLNKEIV